MELGLRLGTGRDSLCLGPAATLVALREAFLLRRGTSSAPLVSTCLTPAAPLSPTPRAGGSSTRAPTRGWSRRPWPSVRSTAAARTACWRGTPTAPGAQPPLPVSPCTRPRAPTGMRRAPPARAPVPGQVSDECRLSCRGWIQEMSGDASLCPGEWVLSAGSPNHREALGFCGFGVRFVFLSPLRTEAQCPVADPWSFSVPLVAGGGSEAVWGVSAHGKALSIPVCLLLSSVWAEVH